MTVDTPKAVFISGGTGSIGRALLMRLLQMDEVDRVTIFSRDELKQWELEESLHSPKLRLVLGDVRDAERVSEAMEGHQWIVHAAALKQVPKGESNPAEFLKTNVLGTEHMLKAAKTHLPEAFIFLSTDKAVNPTSNYGSGKLTSEKMVCRAAETSSVRFITLRLGNVMGTRGTVIPKFLKERGNGILEVTDPESTRFHLTLSDTVDHILHILKNGIGGETVVPKLKAFRLADLVQALDHTGEVRVTGLRKGEKKHEQLLSENERRSAIENSSCYIVPPDFKESHKYDYLKHYQANPISPELMYASDQVDLLTVGELRHLINEFSAEKPELHRQSQYRDHQD